MKYYINKNKEIFAFELDGSQDHLITEDMSLISLEEIEAINKAKQDEYMNSLEYKLNEANSYLTATDWVEAYKLRNDLGLELIPEDSSKWEVINKREEYIEFLKGAN
jgi:hypothetical protein